MDVVDRADHFVQHLADVLRADDDRLGALERLARPGGEAGTAADRVLELRPVDLTMRGTPAAAATGPPMSAWFAKTRSAGSSPRSAAALAST